MKSFLFVTVLLSFVVYRAANLEEIMQGTWEGSYRTIGKMVDVKIVFGGNNRIELYSSEIKDAGKATGSYTVSNSNEIAINFKWPGGNSVSFTMYGRLSKGGNFVDGDWKSDDLSYGSFYLAKAGSK